MTEDSGFIAPFRISTGDFPEKDRLSAWTDEFCRTVLKLDFEPIPDVPFYQAATLRKLPGLSMAAGESTGCSVSRTKQHIAEGAGGLSFCIHQEGAPFQCSQSGQTVTVAAGQGVLLIDEEVSSVLMPGACRAIMINVPPGALAGWAVVPLSSAMRKIPQDSEALRLLGAYLSRFDTADVQTDADSGLLGKVFVNHVHDLLALALQPGRETWDRAKGGLRAARLHAIKNDILARLAQSDLSVSSVAARQGVSPRYVQRLFEEEGTSFTAFMLNARLTRAHRMLSDPLFAGHTIGAIAYEAGFPDLSNFNRYFRRRYGMTPSDVRVAAQPSGGLSQS